MNWKVEKFLENMSFSFVHLIKKNFNLFIYVDYFLFIFYYFIIIILIFGEQEAWGRNSVNCKIIINCK